ncbi:MAG: hypothetical protein R3D57_07010 [Hyphomicrobiaceae bacterium]
MTSKTKRAVTNSATKTKARRAKSASMDHGLVWRDITARVRHAPDYLSKGWSHIEINVQKPKGAPLPITETGYRSHFLDADDLERAGGPVRCFLDWIERGSRSKSWAKAEFT